MARISPSVSAHISPLHWWILPRLPQPTFIAQKYAGTADLSLYAWKIKILPLDFSSQCIFTNAWEVSAENPISFLEIPIHLNSCLVLYNDLKSLFLNIITLIDIGCCRSTRYFVLNKVLTVCRLINWLCY